MRLEGKGSSAGQQNEPQPQRRRPTASPRDGSPAHTAGGEAPGPAAAGRPPWRTESRRRASHAKTPRRKGGSRRAGSGAGSGAPAGGRPGMGGVPGSGDPLQSPLLGVSASWREDRSLSLRRPPRAAMESKRRVSHAMTPRRKGGSRRAGSAAGSRAPAGERPGMGGVPGGGDPLQSPLLGVSASWREDRSLSLRRPPRPRAVLPGSGSGATLGARPASTSDRSA
jgi:hypothetical protein